MANPNQDARDARGHYVRTPETAARDARAAELRTQGLTFQQIADELGYTHKQSAADACRRALRDIVKGPAEKLLALHVERLETLYEKALEVLEADHVVVSHGKVVTMADPETGEEKPLKDNGPKLAAIREARATMESFRKLMGLDQPTQVSVSGAVRYEVVGVDPTDLT
ncbi:hypothetical protein ACH40E_02915 [Streptomyces acidicola]|uniref:hypothetical protein n=1 Tax=Streptomyces acidicola TaxID=2596892 RepID=UPI0037BC0028